MESINSIVKLRRVARQSRTAQAVAMFWSAGHGQCQENIVAARIILGDFKRYGGESAGPVIWARMVCRREAELWRGVAV
jgi:hypothetical protein